MKLPDWAKYAQVYDLMAEHNPAYQEIVSQFVEFLRSLPCNGNDTLLDLGAGTGNFSLVAAREHALSTIVHLEPDADMNRQCRQKMVRQGVRNVQFVEEKIDFTSFEPQMFSAVVSVHSLYVLPSPRSALEKIALWLKPGGRAFICDVGRVLDIADWRRFMLGSLLKRQGLRKTLSLLVKGQRILTQNRLIARNQSRPVYWTHTPEQFRNMVESAGLAVLKQDLVYRGYSDLVIAEKKA